MDKTIDTYKQMDRYQAKEPGDLTNFIDELNLPFISNLKHIIDINEDTRLLVESICNVTNFKKKELKPDQLIQMSNRIMPKTDSFIDDICSEEMRSIFNRVNRICDSYGKNLISSEEFTKMMEQIKKDKEEVEEAYTKDRIKHRVEDYQGMLSVFTEGSQSFLTTQVAISQLKSML